MQSGSSYFIGQTIEPGMFPVVEDVYRVDTTVERKWFVVQSDPRAPKAVVDNVERAGFATYSPERTYWGKRGRITRRMVRLTGVLMPGYLFVHLPEEGAFDTIRRCNGVYRLVDSSGSPAVIPDSWIDWFRRREKGGAFDATKRRRGVRNDKSPFPDWIFAGAIVRIAEGPFKSFNALVTAARNGCVFAEVAIFGRSTPAEFELAQVGPLC